MSYHIPKATRWIAGALASVVTLVCAGMAAMSALDRSTSVAGSAMFVTLALVMVVGSHLLPALARHSWVGRGVFAVCVVVTLYNHAYFFDSEKHSKGVQQQASVAPSADVVRYEAELALIAARSLPVVSADIAAASATAAKANAELERCLAKEGVRCTSAKAALEVAQAKVIGLNDERAQAMRAEDLRVALAGAVAAHSAKVSAAGINRVDASVAKLLHVDADTVATLTSVLQSIALEVMGALLWTVALPRSTKKTKVQEVKIKHVMPYNIPKPPQLLGWARTMLIQHQGQPRDSPVRR